MIFALFFAFAVSLLLEEKESALATVVCIFIIMPSCARLWSLSVRVFERRERGREKKKPKLKKNETKNEKKTVLTLLAPAFSRLSRFLFIFDALALLLPPDSNVKNECKIPSRIRKT